MNDCTIQIIVILRKKITINIYNIENIIYDNILGLITLYEK
jgi:hypothetical protein